MRVVNKSLHDMYVTNEVKSFVFNHVRSKLASLIGSKLDGYLIDYVKSVLDSEINNLKNEGKIPDEFGGFRCTVNHDRINLEYYAEFEEPKNIDFNCHKTKVRHNVKDKILRKRIKERVERKKMSKTSELTKEQFADRLFSQGVPVPAIRLITGLTNYKVDAKSLSNTNLVPIYGLPMISTPEPTTDFEKSIKNAGTYKTVEEAAKSILTLERLRKEAVDSGDSKALYAVLNRALITACRANLNGKSDQARMFSDWLANVLLNN